MGRIAAARTTSFVRLLVCTRCWLVVPPDRDQCPNPDALIGEQHPLRSYVPEEHLAHHGVVEASIAAAEACLETAKAGLRGR
jgi:hypothetical protein